MKYLEIRVRNTIRSLPNFVQSTFENRPRFARFYCTNVKLGVYFLRLMRDNKFLRVLRLIKRPRKSGMQRRWRRNSIIPWIMLFERLYAPISKLVFKHTPRYFLEHDWTNITIINERRLVKSCRDIKLKKQKFA